MASESDSIRNQIDELKRKYEADTHALEQEQRARLIKLENEIALQEQTFEQSCRIALEKLQAEIDKAQKDKKEALQLRLKKLKDSQELAKLSNRNSNKLKIESLKAQFLPEKHRLEEKYHTNLRDLERRLAEAIANEKEEEKKKKEEEERKKKEVEKDLLITLTHFPKWWPDAQIAPIHFTAIGSQVVVAGGPLFNTFVASITFTVSGETNVVLTFGTTGSSGTMDFGAPGEPMAITMNFSDTPAPLGHGSFSISADGDSINVAGFVIYYRIPVKEKKK